MQANRVVLFNGPPYSGKDTAAEAMLDVHFPGYSKHFDKFSMPLKRMVCAMARLNCDYKGYSPLEETKDVPNEHFLGKTYREMQIHLSEDFFKPIFGVDVFGQLLVARIRTLVARRNDPTIILVSDSGFIDEAYPVITAFPTLIVQIERPNTSFVGDSRGYIQPSGATIVRTANNSNDKKLYAFNVKSLIDRWVYEDK